MSRNPRTVRRMLFPNTDTIPHTLTGAPGCPTSSPTALYPTPATVEPIPGMQNEINASLHTISSLRGDSTHNSQLPHHFFWGTYTQGCPARSLPHFYNESSLVGFFQNLKHRRIAA
ncbi:hypothetical protein XENTR_v10023194 [Xenopus tropicalis]|nr:hypothetical protein XENTR_v10023194 [Xenopus tropicalis]